ncbi:MAG: ribosome silencing factor [Myxococcales bacterium]|nr:ribosome silencing factor [Myxococcales bacterium]|tara:strand:- start:780 stop:1184 length:405 start_codon:yes stop_codon:yes gene_type:complete
MPEKANANVEPVQDYVLDDVLKEIADASIEKRAERVRILDVRKAVTYTDAVVICSGQSDRQLRTIADYIDRQLRKKFQLHPSSVEGRDSASWVCMDYGDIIIHVFYGPARMYYDIDNVWPEGMERTDELVEYPD